MTQLLRLLAEDDKAQALREACARLRAGEPDPRHFAVAPDAFGAVPGKPFFILGERNSAGNVSTIAAV